MNCSTGRLPSRPPAGRPGPLTDGMSNGWVILRHELLVDQLERLTVAAERETATGATSRRAGRAGPNTKLLAHLLDLIYVKVPTDPASPAYEQGSTLGPAHRHWRRAKTGNGRYRLFFRYRADARVIIFAWVNDQATLRARGKATDAYYVFRGMLGRGHPPSDWDALLSEVRKARDHDSTRHDPPAR